MFTGHNPYLVALSVVIAILGGYTGFGLAARLRGNPNVSRRLLLATAAVFLAIGIWTMHFVGMLAAPIPDDAVYLVLPTIISFLICALVVGVSLFFVSIGDTTEPRLISSALLLGLGIFSMHYVGIHGLQGDFHVEHRTSMIVLSALIAVCAAYGGLRIFLAEQGGRRLALSATAFGLAVSGMHYTAMYGMSFVPGSAGHGSMHGGGLVASAQTLALIVSLLCFLIVGGFLLSLVPDARRATAGAGGAAFPEPEDLWRDETGAAPVRTLAPSLPLGGIGQPARKPAARIPVESSDGILFVETTEVRSIRADAHYTMVHDGSRERMSPWSISQAESQLDPATFIRVHRSHIVAVPHIALMRKEGDAAVVELDGPAPHLAPVSRPRIAELRARLGLHKRQNPAAPGVDVGQQD